MHTSTLLNVEWWVESLIGSFDHAPPPWGVPDTGKVVKSQFDSAYIRPDQDFCSNIFHCFSLLLLVQLVVCTLYRSSPYTLFLSFLNFTFFHLFAFISLTSFKNLTTFGLFYFSSFIFSFFKLFLLSSSIFPNLRNLNMCQYMFPLITFTV